MTHEVLISVPQQIVALGTVGAEIEILEYGDQLGEPILHLSAGTEFALIVEVRLIDDPLEIVCLGEPGDNLVDFVANLNVAFQFHHVGKAAAIGDFNERIKLDGVLCRRHTS